jgi:nitrite reductase (NADH) small subunit
MGPVSPGGRAVTVARLDELHESFPKVVRVDNLELVLVRLGDEVHAIDNLCPHRGGPLGYGLVDGGGIICPWHRIRFNLNTGESLTWHFGAARVYPVAVQNDNVVVIFEES